MGYRSDVAYTIRFDHDDERVASQSFYTFLSEAKSHPNFTAALSDKELEIDEARRRINFFSRDTKWYPSYPDVSSHDALVNLADEWCTSVANQACAYIFMRIGEDDSDIERKCGGNYEFSWINLKRELEVDWN
jgi:hypothetical protein